MRVCVTHRCWNHPDDSNTERCPLGHWEWEITGGTLPCELVSMRLIPDNYPNTCPHCGGDLEQPDVLFGETP